MARVDVNDLTLGLRGRFGKQFVFRKHGKKTVASRRQSGISTTLTKEQEQHREKFRLATQYARACMLQPDVKEEYAAIARAKENASAFAAAVGDYLAPVSIEAILTAFYNGQAGFPLSVMVTDVYKVKTMNVTFTSADGVILESGSAIPADGGKGYTYMTTVSILDTSGLIIKVEVTDRPGNVISKEVTLT